MSKVMIIIIRIINVVIIKVTINISIIIRTSIVINRITIKLGDSSDIRIDNLVVFKVLR